MLDGDEFLPNWGLGEDNCGNETNLAPKGDINRVGSVVTVAEKDFLLDIVGKYTAIIGGKSYDTICVMLPTRSWMKHRLIKLTVHCF